MRCRCLWADVRCPNRATQEDGLCDWCGTRRVEDLRNNPKAMFGPDGEYLGLGGAGEAHVDPDRRPDACWMPDSCRTLVVSWPVPDWPHTWRCLDCGYVGWPNTTDLRDGGLRRSCPRSQGHQPMVSIKITAHIVTDGSGS